MLLSRVQFQLASVVEAAALRDEAKHTYPAYPMRLRQFQNGWQLAHSRLHGHEVQVATDAD
jgi:hypothetical protein